MRTLLILALGLAVASVGITARRIVGGSVTTINQYPFAVVLLLSPSGTGTFRHSCGGSIINNRAVLSAAHCVDNFRAPSQWNLRVGSSFSNSSGIVHTTNTIIRHPSYTSWNLNNDIAVLRINGQFSFNNNVRAGSIAGANYNLADNTPVWAVGWGTIYYRGPVSIQLRHVQVWTVNQALCRTRYAGLGLTVNDNMLCSGWLDVGGRDACQGDSGGPLLHNNVIVGVTSWGEECALAHYPGVSVRVSRYTSWILSNQ